MDFEKTEAATNVVFGSASASINYAKMLQEISQRKASEQQQAPLFAFTPGGGDSAGAGNARGLGDSGLIS